MSLLTPTETVNARIAADAEQLAAHLTNAVILANRITGHALDLPTDQLNEWLNSRPLDTRNAEFLAHGMVGDSLNKAAMFSEAATSKPIPRVDIRSVQEKLAEKGKVLAIANGTYVVTDLPAPEPEQPTPDPENVEP